ncbi:Uncharacterised protein [Dermatophilus congolensis]|uniref:Uncharacterized protein n=1 Tax=Dermatophilus congolensis TaxID=1863 RepID=A0AA46BMQ1_9MICO|nr:Uncharacterised protein [Dermatophilus congolensis]
MEFTNRRLGSSRESFRCCSDVEQRWQQLVAKAESESTRSYNERTHPTPGMGDVQPYAPQVNKTPRPNVRALLASPAAESHNQQRRLPPLEEEEHTHHGHSCSARCSATSPNSQERSPYSRDYRSLDHWRAGMCGGVRTLVVYRTSSSRAHRSRCIHPCRRETVPFRNRWDG